MFLLNRLNIVAISEGSLRQLMILTSNEHEPRRRTVLKQIEGDCRGVDGGGGGDVNDCDDICLQCRRRKVLMFKADVEYFLG